MQGWVSLKLLANSQTLPINYTTIKNAINLIKVITLVNAKFMNTNT